MSEPSVEETVADLPRLAAEHDVPGVSVAIWDQGRLTEATAGVINTRTAVPVTADTLFMIQSITKLLTATLVMQLVDERLVDLDATVVSVLPEFRTADPEVSRSVTLRHLLTHTGGFEGDLWAPTTDGDDALERFVSDLVPGAAQHSPPGERFSYNNAGYGVLGRIVEVLRRTGYEAAVRQHLTDPLGVDEPAFSADQALAFRTAIGHVRPSSGSALRPLRHWAVMPASNPAAGNRLAMSARGLLGFARMHLDEGRSTEGATVLSPASVAMMRHRQVDHPAVVEGSGGHGLGWWLRDGRVEHGGGGDGVAALLRVRPGRDRAAVVLANADGGHALAARLLDPLFPEEPAGGEDDARPLPPDAGDPVGHYESRQFRVEVAAGADGRLRCRIVPRHDVVTMARLAGTQARAEERLLRPHRGAVFALVAGDGTTTELVQFLGRDAHGRARFVVRGQRTIPRSV